MPLAVEARKVVNELASAENGGVIFSSTKARQYALEDSEWGNRATSFCLPRALSHSEIHLRPLFNGRVDRVQQPEKIIIGPPACIASILLPRAHLQFRYVSVKGGGGHLQGTDRLRRVIYDPVLGTF